MKSQNVCTQVVFNIYYIHYEYEEQNSLFPWVVLYHKILMLDIPKMSHNEIE